MTTPTDLAQALRDFCDKMDTFHPRGEMGALHGAGMAFAYKDAAQEIRRILAAHESRAQPASVAVVPWVAILNAVRAYERTVGDYPRAKDRTTLRKQCRSIHDWLAAAPQPQAKSAPAQDFIACRCMGDAARKYCMDKNRCSLCEAQSAQDPTNDR